MMEDFRLYIRKLIEESLEKQLIEEDYVSIKEIKELANDVLLYVAKSNFDYFKRQLEDGNIQFFYPVRLLDVYQENPKKFPTLQNFIINSKIMIHFTKPSDSGRLGDYSHYDEEEYDETKSRTIRLYPRHQFFEDITNKFQEVKNISYKDIYFTMWYAFNSTLQHELQHAYDDFRSNSKIFQTKRNDKYMDKYLLPSGREYAPTDPTLAGEKHISYLKLQHEIWARFTQAINEIHFTSVDFAKTPEGLMYVEYSMHPLEKVLKDFQYKFTGWRAMSDDVKKRMIRRVSNYWHKEKENLDVKNQQSIEKEKEAANKKQLAEIRTTVRNTLSEAFTGMEEYKKWKRNNVMVRGISSDGTLDVANGAGARFGEGLYMAALSNKAMAKGYGKVYFVVNGKPKNPKVFKDTNLAEIWIQQNLIYNKYKNVRDFEANTSISKEMLKLGYDGIEIKGRETVNFAPPEDVKYYSTENALIQHYEHYVENQITETIQEDYPSSFSLDAFKALTSFKERVEYCNAHLKRLGSGSSRIVYQIDAQKVLKLAKNKKGIVQNEGEVDAASQSYYSNIAEVFDYDENGLWVEMELARKVTPNQFKAITGFDINDVKKYLQAFQNSTQGRSTSGFYLKPELEKAIMQDPFVDSLRDFIANTDALAGDVGTISSFGLVNRGGEDVLVLVDFGLNEQDYNNLYRESVSVVQEANDTNLWIHGGILLVKGKPFEDGTQGLYAFHIINLNEFGRTKVDNTPGKSAKMAVLDNNVFRIVIENGQLRAMKMDFRFAASLSRTIKFNGRQSHAVTLNNNKTPLHWETLKYNNFPQLFKNAGTEIMGLPNIKWTL